MIKQIRIYLIGGVGFLLWLAEMGIGAYLAIVFGCKFRALPGGTVSVAPGFYMILFSAGVILLLQGVISLCREVRRYRLDKAEGKVPKETSVLVATLWVFHQMPARPWQRFLKKD